MLHAKEDAPTSRASRRSGSPPRQIHERDPDDSGKGQGEEVARHCGIACSIHQRLYAEKSAASPCPPGSRRVGKDGVIRSVLSRGPESWGVCASSRSTEPPQRPRLETAGCTRCCPPAASSASSTARTTRTSSPSGCGSRCPKTSRVPPGPRARVGSHADGRGDDGREGLPQCLKVEQREAITGADARRSLFPGSRPVPSAERFDDGIHRRARTHLPRRRRSGRPGTSFRSPVGPRSTPVAGRTRRHARPDRTDGSPTPSRVTKTPRSRDGVPRRAGAASSSTQSRVR